MWLRYNPAKLHHCGVSVTDLKLEGWGDFSPPSVSRPEKTHPESGQVSTETNVSPFLFVLIFGMISFFII